MAKEFVYYQHHETIASGDSTKIIVQPDSLVNRQITIAAKGTTTSLKVLMRCGNSTLDLATVASYVVSPTGGTILVIPFLLTGELHITCDNVGGTGVTDISVYGSNS